MTISDGFKYHTFGKRMAHEIIATLLGHGPSCEQDGELYLKFYIGKGMPPVYQRVPNKLGLLGAIMMFGGGTLPPTTLLGIGVGFRDKYNIGVHRSWWILIDMDCILLHVKFEGKLSIWVLRNRGNFS
jgi:hypothetical protein